MSIANCGQDERGKYSGGKAGDQTGKEYCVKPWYRYSGGWDCVIRFTNPTIGQEIARVAKAAAENDNIGYDQNERLTFYNTLKKAGWLIKNIKTKCEADCSASTSAIVIAVGYRLGIGALKKVSPSNTTRTIKADLKKAGAKILTDSKYTSSDEYALPGDIYLKEGHHVMVNLTKGKKA